MSEIGGSISHGMLRADAQRIAVIMPSWVGDAVMATPVLRALREHRPGASIIAIVRPGLDVLLAGHSHVDEIIVSRMKGVAGAWRLASSVRSSHADSAVLLPNSFRSALGPWLARTAQRIGYARDGRGMLLTDPVPRAKSKTPVPAVRYYSALMERVLGATIENLRLELACTPEEEAAADALLHDVSQPFGLLNPGANRVDKRWPAERFAAAADALHNERGVAIVVTGSPGERELINDVISHARSPCIDLAARGVQLGSLKAVVRRAALLITNDTGPRHLAAALGTPCVVLFGPTDHRWTTLPIAREHALLAEPFLPEELVADRQPKGCAIERIRVSDVVRAALTMLDASAPAR